MSRSTHAPSAHGNHAPTPAPLAIPDSARVDLTSRSRSRLPRRKSPGASRADLFRFVRVACGANEALSHVKVGQTNIS